MKLKTKYLLVLGPEHNIINIQFIQELYICTLYMPFCMNGMIFCAVSAGLLTKKW